MSRKFVIEVACVGQGHFYWTKFSENNDKFHVIWEHQAMTAYVHQTRHQHNTRRRAVSVDPYATNTSPAPKLGDVALLDQSRVGVIRYIGPLEGRSRSLYDHYLGIEIRITDGIMGDCNGSYLGKSYFKCPTNTGTFIKSRQIKQIYSPEVGIYALILCS